MTEKNIPLTTRTRVNLPPNWDQMSEEEKTKWVIKTNNQLENGEEPEGLVKD